MECQGTAENPKLVAALCVLQHRPFVSESFWSLAPDCLIVLCSLVFDVPMDIMGLKDKLLAIKLMFPSLSVIFNYPPCMVTNILLLIKFSPLKRSSQPLGNFLCFSDLNSHGNLVLKFSDHGFWLKTAPVAFIR